MLEATILVRQESFRQIEEQKRDEGNRRFNFFSKK